MKRSSRQGLIYGKSVNWARGGQGQAQIITLPHDSALLCSSVFSVYMSLGP